MECLRGVGYRTGLESLAYVNRGHSSGEICLLLGAIADHHNLVEVLRVLLQDDSHSVFGFYGDCGVAEAADFYLCAFGDIE